MVNDVYDTVQRSLLFTRNHRFTKKQRELRQFPLSGHLDVVALNIPGRLLNTRGGNKYVFVLTGRYSNLTEGLPFQTRWSQEMPISS